jgi:hypothetical protein
MTSSFDCCPHPHIFVNKLVSVVPVYSYFGGMSKVLQILNSTRGILIIERCLKLAGGARKIKIYIFLLPLW